jgi:2,3-bisphosphoglycerate-independent phosphoglycerate mutase
MNRQVVLAIMDGVGLTDRVEGNAFKNAYTPNLDKIIHNSIAIHAHGTYVGLPSDEDMGNSEVGHNAMGCGQIYSQGAKLVNEALDSYEKNETTDGNKVLEELKLKYGL